MHRCRMSRSRLCARGATANPAPPRGCSAAASSPPCAVLLPVFLQNRRDPNFYHPPTDVGSLLDANVCIDSASQLQGIHGRLSDLPVLSLAMELISHQTSPAGKRQSVCGCVESLEGCEEVVDEKRLCGGRASCTRPTGLHASPVLRCPAASRCSTLGSPDSAPSHARLAIAPGPAVRDGSMVLIAFAHATASRLTRWLGAVVTCAQDRGTRESEEDCDAQRGFRALCGHPRPDQHGPSVLPRLRH